MANQEDKGQSEMFDKSDIMGKKPFSSIGEDRSAEQQKSVVNKLKKKRKANSGIDSDDSVAEGTESDSKVNGGSGVSKAIGNFVNR